MEFHSIYSVSNASQWVNNLKVDKANKRNAGIGGLNPRHKDLLQRCLEKHNETLKTKNQNISYWDDDIRGGLRGTAHLAGLRSASMRSLASKQEVTFCSRSPAITPPGNKDVIKRCAARSQTPTEPQNKHASISEIH